MNFVEFASNHGLIVRSLVPGRWMRVPTETHPRSKNGAYFFDREYGFVQDWSAMTSPVLWKTDKVLDAVALAAMQARMRDSQKSYAEARRIEQAKAAVKATWIISQAKMEQHAYLDSKGFPNSLGLVWRPDDDANLLIIPMRIDKQIVGTQLIDRDGNKKFLTGQRTHDAEYVIGSKGVDIYCEGYATGLSAHTVLAALKIHARVHICFSAGNLVRLAKNGFVVADNDASGTGQKAAEATNLPYLISDYTGEDFNDLWRRVGTLQAGMLLRNKLRNGACPEPGKQETKPVSG
ncbi:MAG: hypothetical protein ACYC4K_08275 [Thiobacillus sp.]